MLFKDIDIFLSAARAILQGVDPYSLPNTEVFYPLPFYFLFIPFVSLPLPVVHVLWTGLQAGILVAILRRRALSIALAMPVLLIFIFGQVNILTMALFALLRAEIAGGLALAFLCLNPKPVLLLAPWELVRWWRRDRRQLVLFGLVLGVLAFFSFYVQPDWVLRWFSRLGERMRIPKSSSLWGLLFILPEPIWLGGAALVTFMLVVWAWRRNDFDFVTTIGLFTSPFVFSYDLMPLFLFVRDVRLLLGLTVLSWLAFGIAAWQESDSASALITLAVLAALIIQKAKPGLSPGAVERTGVLS